MSFAFRVSIGANIVLAGVVAALLWRDRPPAAAVAAPAAPRMDAGTGSTERGELGREPRAAAGSGGRLDPAALVELERRGISRVAVVDALLVDFERRWEKRHRDLAKRYAPKPVPEREYVELARWREADQIRELKEALGEEGYLAWDKEQTLGRVNAAGVPLTAEEAEQAFRLQKDFEQQHKELQMAMEDGVADRADVAKLQQRAQEKLESELEALFGRARLDEMRGITGPTAEVEWRFADLNPTVQQANAVLQAENDYRAREAALAAKLKETPGQAGDIAAELKALNDAREEHLRGIFGGEAYDNVKRENDPTFKTLKQFADAWQLDDQQIRTVHDALGAFHDGAERTRTAASMAEAAGQPVNWREIDAAIERARQQTEAGLQNLIGGERLYRLKQNGLLTHR